jgi:hypothetical protein
VLTCFPVKAPSIVILNPRIIGTNKLDSGSRKGNTSYNLTKAYEEIVLFEPFEIPQPVLNPEVSGCGMTPVGF